MAKLGRPLEDEEEPLARKTTSLQSYIRLSAWSSSLFEEKNGDKEKYKDINKTKIPTW